MISPADRPGPGYGFALLVAVLFFAAVAPTLNWLEFSGGSENLVVGAVVEMERGGPKLVPNLQGEPRIKKPPLPTWIAASGVRRSTMEQTASRDQPTRDAAFKRLAFEIRWTSLAAACLMLVAVYGLGRTIADGRVGIVAALMAGSTLMFLRFGRAATTDVQLALWVALANFCLATWVFRGRAWVGTLGGGAALGLAFMSKGPVALLQTVVPFVLFVAWRAWDKRRGVARRAVGENSATPPHAGSPVLMPLLAGVGAFLLIAMPWYVAVVAHHPGALHEWFSEVSRADATELPPDPWYVYLVLFLYCAPWVAWFVAGGITALARVFGSVPDAPEAASPPGLKGFPTFGDAWEDDEPSPASSPDRSHALVLALLLTFVPVIVMTLFKDKNERYLFPLITPAAILGALSLVTWVDAGRPATRGAVVVQVAQWLTLAAFAIGAPVSAALLKTVEGEPWIYPATAACFTAVGACVVMMGLWLDRRYPYAMVVVGVVLMLLLQYPMLDGYKDYPQGRAELKPLADRIWAVAPDADVYELDVPGRTRTRYDLPIYLGRVTRKTSDPASLPQGARPIAVVYFSGRKAPEPQLAPPWRFAGEGADDKDRWKLFVLAGR